MPIELGSRSIDRFAHTPKYRQLADLLRAAIDDGALQPGEELPGENAIAQQVGISREAVRKALDVIAAEGLIVRRSGAGTRVATPPPQRRLDASRYVDWLKRLKSGETPQGSAFTEAYGIDWGSYQPEVVIAKEPASDRDAELLQVTAGSDVLRREFVKFNAEGDPVEVQRSAIPWSIAGGTDLVDPGRQPWPGGTIGELFHLGIDLSKAGRVTHEVQGRLPNDVERRRLQMETPGPVWDIVRVFWDGDRPVEASRVVAPCNRNLLHYETSLILP